MEEDRRVDRERIQSYNNNLHRDKNKIATRMEEILKGDIYIEPLHESNDSIGKMDHECQYCQALKFKKENSRMCCLDGKVKLPSYPEPPEILKDLWLGEDPTSKVFKNNARVLNNAICLSSVKVTEKKLPGYNPSVIFQGRVTQFMGPLTAADGDARFAQLNCLDPLFLETTKRIHNMNMPTNISKENERILLSLLPIIKNVIHDNNWFVKDFI